MLDIIFRTEAFIQLQYWIEKDRKKSIKVTKLIEHSARNPFDGIGKPEPLKHEMSGVWSRRIDQEHRLVYRVEGNKITILSCRYHY